MRRLLFLLLAISTGLLTQLSHAKPYKGAEVFSNQAYLYGRYEMRMQAANASGVLSTFFTYKDGSQVTGTFWEEIDIEIFGKNNATQWQSNIIYGTGPTHTEETHTESASLAEGYHTYALEWTPEYVAWFVDGVEKRRITATSTIASLTSPQTLRFNIWSSESVPWVGEWDDSLLPVYQFITYIEYKTYNTTTKTFEDGWRDDFDSFDTSRWGKASWTFDTNRVDFAPENAVVKNGILVLALTKENATGYSGTPPADESGSSSSAAINSSVASSDAVSNSSFSSVAASVDASSSAATVSSTPASSTAASSTAASSTAASSTAASKASGGSGGGGAFDWLNIMLLSVLNLILLSKFRRRHTRVALKESVE